MSRIYVMTAAAVVPAIALLLYVYKHDTIEKESPRLILRLFLLGALSGIAAGMIEYSGDMVFPELIDPYKRFYQTAYMFLVVGVAEEGVKYFVLRFCTWNNPEFNYRYDGIVYSVSVSLGFAALENIIYVFGYGIEVAFIRALLAIPAHAGFAVFMGSFYGKAKVLSVRGSSGASILIRLTGYLVSVFLHGFYDSCAASGTELSVAVFILFVIIMDTAVILTIKKESRTDSRIV